jgi:putative transcriptional regulator
MRPSVADRLVSRLQGFTKALENKEAVSKRFTCRKVELKLRPEPYDPSLVKRTRRILNASQPIFAKFIGVSVRTVRAWEQGEIPPNVMACRFMDEIRHDPSRWIKRIGQFIVKKKQTIKS